MCSRVLATIFIIYYLNTGFSEGLLDASCIENADCYHFKNPNQSVTCLDGGCVCRDINGEKVQCNPKDLKQNNIVGGPCPCSMNHSVCHKDICACTAKYTASMDQRRCIKKRVRLGGNCEDNSQCIIADHFSFCDAKTKTCSCLEHFVEHNGECLSVVALDQTCHEHVQCANYTMLAMCSGNKCICSPGSVANSMKTHCLENVGYHEQCSESNQCKTKLGFGSGCYSEICTCDAIHHPVNVTIDIGTDVRCERIIAVGEYCKENKDCNLAGTAESMECVKGQCKCLQGFYRNLHRCEQSGAGLMNVPTMFLFFIFCQLFLYR